MRAVFAFEAEPFEFESEGYSAFEAAEEMEFSFSGFPQSVLNALRSGRESTAVKLAIALGYRNENELTDLVFFVRHPERNGRALSRNEPNYRELSAEWVAIRNSLVQPLLASPAPPSTPPTPAPLPSYTCSVQWPPARVAALRKNIVSIAMAAWSQWNKGQLKEWEPSAFNRLIEYWQVGVGLSPSQASSHARAKTHWSAAFISWVMRQAGAGESFAYASDHGTYIAAAYRNRRLNTCSPFKAYRLNETVPQVGDLVCKRYKTTVPLDLDKVRPATSGYHSNIVVKVEPGKLTTIGGNNSDSVGVVNVRIDANGFVTQAEHFAVIKVG
jgi:Uncharacterized protein conserved in bacteria (DUF2272)